MEFYDSLINDVMSLVKDLPQKSFLHNKDDAWVDVGYNQVIMKRDTAFELSGSSFNLVSSQPVKDETVVIGEELKDIKADCSFARISILHLEDEKDEQKAYNLIRKTDYVKYHLFPKGYMMRTSSRIFKEAVRVEKSALKSGISFAQIGNLMINKYKENPDVKGAKVLFITDSNIDYAKIQSIAVKAGEITETLNHVMNSVNFDCSTCNLKPICDEVEGMKELHFKNVQNGKTMM